MYKTLNYTRRQLEKQTEGTKDSILNLMNKTYSTLRIVLTYLPQFLTHIFDSLLNSFIPSGQKQPSVVKFIPGSLGLQQQPKKNHYFLLHLNCSFSG